MIKHIKGKHEEKLKGVTTTWIWTKNGYVDEQGNLKRNNKDHSKIMKFIAKEKSEIPKYSEVK